MLQSSQYISTKVPTSISALVVNLDQVDNREDVLSDDMGVWKSKK